MIERGTVDDPLVGWDPRRRAALERIWQRFREAGADVRLIDELVAERRQDARAAGRAGIGAEGGVERGSASRSADGGPSGE
ncbi:hypothetical protein [Geodermatophilus marinus]|uniref:hypothetical protein n=1 Tax=Geodermatophilus sp. LHW52908 TaxID=2303986 RepID=UPI000E3BF3C1|nr:hypothetical protein [Geodermatophilus sp. LHW52908]RFU21915.1 hypothetical protein D0Z06_07180 [Geodermatophilus sp. LHW52908]